MTTLSNGVRVASQVICFWTSIIFRAVMVKPLLLVYLLMREVVMKQKIRMELLITWNTWISREQIEEQELVLKKKLKISELISMRIPELLSLVRYTSREQTVYYSSCFSKDIGQVVDLLGDILLHSKYTLFPCSLLDLIPLQSITRDIPFFSKWTMSLKTNTKSSLIWSTAQRLTVAA